MLKPKKISKQTIQSWLPFKDVGSNYILDNDNNYIVPIKLGSLNITLLSQNELNDRIRKLMSVFNSLDYPFQLLFLDKPVDLDQFLNDLEDKRNNATNPQIRRVLQQDLADCSYLLSKENIVEKSYFFLFKVDKNNKEQIFSKSQEVCENFKQFLNINAELCTEQEIRDILFIWMNPQFINEQTPPPLAQPVFNTEPVKEKKFKFPTFESKSEKRIKTFKDMLSPVALSFSKHDISIGEQYTKVLYISKYPSELEGAWLSSIVQRGGVQLSIQATPKPRSELLQALKNTLSDLQGKTYSDKVYERTKAEFEKETVQTLLKQVEYEQQSVFDITVVLSVSANTKEELMKKTKEIQSYFSSNSLQAREVTFYQQQAFLTCSPLARNEIPQFHQNMTSLTLASSFPFVRSGFKDETGYILGTDEKGGLIISDMWKRNDIRTSTNFICLGKTGTGKSTATKKLIRSEYARGTKVIILDPEKEYTDIVNSLGGEIVDASNGNKGRINPLQVRAIDLTDTDDNEENTSQSLAHHISFVKSFFEIYKEFNRQQSDLLEIYLEKLYIEKSGLDWNVNPLSISEEQQPSLIDLYDLIEKDIENDPKNELLKDLLLALHSCAKGTDSFTLNGKTTLNIQTKLISIDLFELMQKNKAIKNAQLFNIITWCWNEMSKDRSERVLLICDEFYLYADELAILIALRNMMKRARKYESGIGLITQDLVDFVSDDIKRYGQALFDNTTYKYIFGQGEKGIEALSTLMGLSDGEIKLLSKGKRGNCLYICGSERASLNVRITKEEEETFGKNGGR